MIPTILTPLLLRLIDIATAYLVARGVMMRPTKTPHLSDFEPRRHDLDADHRDHMRAVVAGKPCRHCLRNAADRAQAAARAEAAGGLRKVAERDAEGPDYGTGGGSQW